MVLEFLSEKNNYVTVSQSDALSDKLRAMSFGVKDSSGDIYWQIATEVDGTVWMKVNFLEPIDVNTIEFSDNGRHEGSEVLYSIDDVNYYVLEKKSRGWYDYSNISATFVKILFKKPKAGFELNALRIWGDETIEVKQDLISIIANRYYPQRFFEKNLLIPQILKTYLMMLETNEGFGTLVQPIVPNTCKIEVFLIFDEGDDGPGYVNNTYIDAHPINSASSTIFVGLNTAVINRVAGGSAFYDLDGNLFPNGFGLRFNAVVNWENPPSDSPTIYKWDFGDPYANQSNPNLVRVLDGREIVHVFSKLGNYDVRFVVVKDGVAYEGTQRVEISPSPYVIRGDIDATNGSVYTVAALTRYPDGTYAAPYLVYDDGTTPIPENLAALADNGDRTFTLAINGLNTTGYIKIVDEFYGEIVEKLVTFTS